MNFVVNLLLEIVLGGKGKGEKEKKKEAPLPSASPQRGERS
jgi:hypothetical protein